MTRWFKRISKALFALVALLAAGLGLWVFHTQPMYDGQLKSEGLKEPVNIKRDAADVVHIFAQSDRDAAFALGFAHAQDRSWQLEFNRRIMQGELSEILGEATLPTDKLMRTLGLMHVAQKQLELLPVDVREQLLIAMASTPFMPTAHKGYRQSLR
jgi:penicillin G amidase